MSPPSLTWADICRRRLEAQHLRTPLPAASFHRMVGDVCGLMGDAKHEELLASGWGAVLKPVAFQGQLCFGPSDGNRVTFVRPDQWIGPFEPPDPVEALKEVARRFLAAYGPARVEEFARWWGVQPKAIRGVLRSEHGFREVDVDGKAAWAVWADGDGDGDGVEGPVVRLLPLLDPYTVAVRRNGERPLTGPEKDLVYRKAGWISPVLMVDGELVGVWEHAETKSGLTVDIRPFAPLSGAVTELAAAEAERLGVLLGIPAVVRFGPRGSGFHRAAHTEEPFIGRRHEREMPGMTLGFPNEHDRPATIATPGAPDPTIRSSRK